MDGQRRARRKDAQPIPIRHPGEARILTASAQPERIREGVTAVTHRRSIAELRLRLRKEHFDGHENRHLLARLVGSDDQFLDLYFLLDKDRQYRGGMAFGWDSRDDLRVGLFVGVPLSMFRL